MHSVTLALCAGWDRRLTGACRPLVKLHVHGDTRTQIIWQGVTEHGTPCPPHRHVQQHTCIHHTHTQAQQPHNPTLLPLDINPRNWVASNQNLHLNVHSQTIHGRQRVETT